LGGLLTELFGTADALWWLVGLTAPIAVVTMVRPRSMRPPSAGESPDLTSPVSMAA
jgi:hypothetical protein